MCIAIPNCEHNINWGAYSYLIRILVMKRSRKSSKEEKCKNLFSPKNVLGHDSTDLVDLTRILFVDAVQRKGSQQCHRLVVKLQAAILEGDVVNNDSNSDLDMYLKSVFKLSKRLMWKIYPLIGEE